MKINMNEDELKSAVMSWIEGEGLSLTGKDVAIDFTAGRAPSGHSADVTITTTEPPTAKVTQEVTKTEVAVEPEPEAEEEDDSSPFLDDVVDGNQPALDLDMD